MQVRENLTRALSKHAEDEDFSSCEGYVTGIAKLISLATLKIMADQRKVVVSTQANKADIVRALLDDGWPLPTDEEIIAAFNSKASTPSKAKQVKVVESKASATRPRGKAKDRC